MKKNTIQPIEKKTLIKRFLIILLAILIYAAFLFFFSVQINRKTIFIFLISVAIVLPFIIGAAMIGYKYRIKTPIKRKKTPKSYAWGSVFFGIVVVVISIIQLIIGEPLGVVLGGSIFGVIIIVYGIHSLIKNNRFAKKNTKII